MKTYTKKILFLALSLFVAGSLSAQTSWTSAPPHAFAQKQPLIEFDYIGNPTLWPHIINGAVFWSVNDNTILGYYAGWVEVTAIPFTPSVNVKLKDIYALVGNFYNQINPAFSPGVQWQVDIYSSLTALQVSPAYGDVMSQVFTSPTYGSLSYIVATSGSGINLYSIGFNFRTAPVLNAGQQYWFAIRGLADENFDYPGITEAPDLIPGVPNAASGWYVRDWPIPGQDLSVSTTALSFATLSRTPAYKAVFRLP